MVPAPMEILGFEVRRRLGSIPRRGDWTGFGELIKDRLEFTDVTL
jgi:hypothetical protein